MKHHAQVRSRIGNNSGAIEVATRSLATPATASLNGIAFGRQAAMFGWKTRSPSGLSLNKRFGVAV